MAVNAFLVFFFGVDPVVFRRKLWIYCLICFGVPGVSAFALLFLRGNFTPTAYGEATVRESLRSCTRMLTFLAVVLDLG